MPLAPLRSRLLGSTTICTTAQYSKHCCGASPEDVVASTDYTYLLYSLGYSTFLRIEFGKWFLGTSCQKKLMRSNIFFLKSYMSNCNEVEALAKKSVNTKHISKIPSRGWRAWKNWFLIIATFLDRAIFQSIRSEKMGQKRTGAKMSKVSKITLFMLVDLTNEFLKYVLYLQTFCQGFYIIAIGHIRLQKKIIWSHQFLLTSWAT